MSGRLAGRIALVTGSGRGIGRAVAKKFASEGARVVVNDLDADVAAEVVREIEASGGEAAACVGNVTGPDFADRLIHTAVTRFGGVDIIVNNAGYTWDSVLQKTTDEQWYAMMDCHLTAPFRILRAAQPIIRAAVKTETEQGRRVVRKVINVSSIAGLFGNPGQANYAAAKAGIIGLTMTLAKEWGRLNTCVNAVAFGLIKTRMTATTDTAGKINIAGQDIKVGINPDLMEAMQRAIPLGRAGTPEDAAGSIFLLAIPESDYVSGQTLMCSGGLTGI